MTDTSNMRVISADGLLCLGSGGTCTVYALDGEHALKAFRDTMPLDNVREEFRRATAAWQAGIPTARPYELVQVLAPTPCYGIVFERLEGSTVAEEVEAGVSDAHDAAVQLGHLLRSLHEVRVDTSVLADQRALFAGYARLLSSNTVNLLNEDEAEGLARLFESLPQSSGFLHGDFHMNNVMHVSDEGADRLVLIDMAGAGSGHPLLDWACTYQACRLIPDYFDPTACKRFLRLSADYARAMLHPMMESYFGTSDEGLLSRQYALMEALGYAKYACMVVREPNPWMDRRLVAAQLREHVISRLDSLLER